MTRLLLLSLLLFSAIDSGMVVASETAGATIEIEEALFRMSSGETDNLVPFMQAHLKKYPKSAKGWSILGSIYYKQEEYDKSIKALMEAVKNASTEEEASFKFALARSLYEAGFYIKAAKAFFSAGKTRFLRQITYFYAGMAYYRAGRLLSAQKCFSISMGMTDSIEIAEDSRKLSALVEMKLRQRKKFVSIFMTSFGYDTNVEYADSESEVNSIFLQGTTDFTYSMNLWGGFLLPNINAQFLFYSKSDARDNNSLTPGAGIAYQLPFSGDSHTQLGYTFTHMLQNTDGMKSYESTNRLESETMLYLFGDGSPTTLILSGQYDDYMQSTYLDGAMYAASLTQDFPLFSIMSFSVKYEFDWKNSRDLDYFYKSHYPELVLSISSLPWEMFSNLSGSLDYRDYSKADNPRKDKVYEIGFILGKEIFAGFYTMLDFSIEYNKSSISDYDYRKIKGQLEVSYEL